MNPHYTYFLYDPKTCCIKIGKSRNVSKRVQQIQAAHSTKLKLLGVLPMDCEKAWHTEFASCQIRGEWFRIDAKLVEDIQQYVNMSFQPRKSKKSIESPIIENSVILPIDTAPIWKMKRCGRCQVTKEITHFARRYRNLRLYRQQWCRQCAREYQRSWRKTSHKICI